MSNLSILFPTCSMVLNCFSDSIVLTVVITFSLCNGQSGLLISWTCTTRSWKNKSCLLNWFQISNCKHLTMKSLPFLTYNNSAAEFGNIQVQIWKISRNVGIIIENIEGKMINYEHFPFFCHQHFKSCLVQMYLRFGEEK